MGRHKLKKFAEVEEMKNVFSKPEHLKGKWREEVFKNEGDVVVEMGCAHGDYARALGEKFSDKNFIGIDRKGDRLWSASKKSSGEDNVVFCWCEGEHLEEYFADGEINEVWITFPDPHSKPCKANRRLISPRFLKVYKKVVKKDGVVHLKTDNKELFDYAVEVLEESNVDQLEIIRDVHGQDEIPELLQIKTYYEKKFIAEGKPIFYLKFSI
ncbi:tRNA (guanosine(46)-N7)-methyltransferase TrmB [Candidatus Peregrinibacteria bacterium]|jgi:tRNA (guanine-N7-)-methyltransferase|nr:tRNA (guanosine(46)-N7)-methyltransferase TrmB [Candidatus Peregrinibacteria bacterium]MBT7736381.1 tRNA (guanosine(46)-N7)-methyltransferase TrmB [Candidatus Peregrinibacteria bacterium]